MNYGYKKCYDFIEIHRNDKMVAKGIIYDDGKCVIRWEGENRSIVIWDSLDDLKKVSGHPGTIFNIKEVLEPIKKCACGLVVY